MFLRKNNGLLNSGMVRRLHYVYSVMWWEIEKYPVINDTWITYHWIIKILKVRYNNWYPTFFNQGWYCLGENLNFVRNKKTEQEW